MERNNFKFPWQCTRRGRLNNSDSVFIRTAVAVGLKHSFFERYADFAGQTFHSYSARDPEKLPVPPSLSVERIISKKQEDGRVHAI